MVVLGESILNYYSVLTLSVILELGLLSGKVVNLSDPKLVLD